MVKFEDFKILHMKRVTFGVTTSPLILAATIKYHIRNYCKEYEKTIKILDKSLYVDNAFYGSSSVDEAIALYSNAVKFLKDAGIILRKFKFNFQYFKIFGNKIILTVNRIILVLF